MVHDGGGRKPRVRSQRGATVYQRDEHQHAGSMVAMALEPRRTSRGTRPEEWVVSRRGYASVNYRSESIGCGRQAFCEL